MGIDLQAISISSAFQSITNFFRSQENNSRWKDYTSGAEGVFLIRMLANIITTISYRLVTARRENYLSTANLLSSVLGLSVNYGYSANRGCNQRRKIQITANGNYTLPKFTVLGSYDADNDIILLEEATLRDTYTTSLVTTIGKVKSIEFQAGTNGFKWFTQYVEGISEDYMLFVDNVEVPTSSNIADLVHDKYLVRTNPHASVDIMYLNNATNATHIYGTESVIRLDYVELSDFTPGDYSSEMFNYGTLGDVITINDYVPFESVASIKRTAPISHSTESLIRSKPDFTNRAQEIVRNIKVASYTPVTPTYTLVTYLKDDYTLMTDEEKDKMLSRLREGETFFGTPLPDITPSKRELINLNIYLELNTVFKDVKDIRQDIDNILATNYEITLNQSFNVYTLERLLESLSYVFRARVSYDMRTRQNSTLFQLGEIISQNDSYYKASKIVGLSGLTEPSWNLPAQSIQEIDTGLETEDGGVIWQAFKRLNVEQITEWQPRTRYGLNDYVYSSFFPDYMFKCVDLKMYSATVPPDVTLVTPGQFVIDGNIVWVCKVTNVTLEERQNSHIYRLGDSVNMGSASFECVSYVGYTANTVPNFEVSSYPIAETLTTGFVLDGDKTDFFLVGDLIKAVSPIFSYAFKITAVVYDNGTNKTTITTAQEVNTSRTYLRLIPKYRGTVDGEIFWDIIPEDEDFNEVQYDWNVYNSFSYTLTTSGR